MTAAPAGSDAVRRRTAAPVAGAAMAATGRVVPPGGREIERGPFRVASPFAGAFGAAADVAA